MPSTTMSSREFSQGVGRSKTAAQAGPVVITRRGRPVHVLLSIADYRRPTGSALSLGAALAEEAPTAFDFNPPRSELRFEIPDL